MANAKISQLPAVTSAAGSDLAVAVASGTTSQVTVDNLFKNRTLVAPALGTPASGTLTNCSGLPISTGVSGLGTNVATALGVNVGSAGAFVVLGGALGTPSSGTLSGCSGLPISTGVSGLGTNVATALATNVGSAGAVVVNGGALGTPASGTVTNLTGTASININGTVGATSPNTGAFTSIDVTNTTNTTANYEPVIVASTLTGAGVTGGRSKFDTTINSAAGSYTNAVKANVTYGASGKTTGLGSSINAEMTLSAGTVDGNYAPVEIELNVPSGASTGTQTAMVYASVNGADAATMDTSGVLVNLQGTTSGAADSTKMVTAPGAAAALTPTLGIKIKIGSDYYYIPLVTQANFTAAV